MQILLPILTTLLAAAATYYFTSRANKRQLAELEAKEKRAKEELNREKRRKFYQLISQHLHASRDAFIEQCRIRDRLLRLLKHDPENFDWEKLEETFADAYPNMNEEQRNNFEFIRGITKTTLLPRNKDMLALLKDNPEYYLELPDFKELLGHLELWMSKYDAHLEKRDDYCLIYVGVKDEKPFPRKIRHKVADILSEMEKPVDE
jgi:hypothetical protein